MWPAGKLRIKADKKYFKISDETFYQLFDGDYLRLGSIYIADNHATHNEYKDKTTFKQQDNIFISIGLPFPSSNSEVLKCSTNIISLTQDINFYGIIYDEELISSIFDAKSFTIEPIFCDSMIKVVEKFFTDELLFRLCLLAFKSFEEVLIDDVRKTLSYQRYYSVNIYKIKNIPIKRLERVDTYSDVIFSKIIYPEQIIYSPFIVDYGLVPLTKPDFYSKYNTRLISANSSKTIAIIMYSGVGDVFKAHSVYLSHKDDVVDDFNNIIFHCFISMLYVHRFNIIHGDSHVGNIVLYNYEKDLYTIEFKPFKEFSSTFRLFHRDTDFIFRVIDFGESFSSEKREKCIEYIKSRNGTYYDIDNIDEKLNDSLDIINVCQFLDVFTLVDSIIESYKYYKNLFKDKQYEKVMNRIEEIYSYIKNVWNMYFSSSKSLSEILELDSIDETDAIFGGIGDFDDYNFITGVINKGIKENETFLINDYQNMPLFKLIRRFYSDKFKN